MVNLNEIMRSYIISVEVLKTVWPIHILYRFEIAECEMHKDSKKMIEWYPSFFTLITFFAPLDCISSIILSTQNNVVVFFFSLRSYHVIHINIVFIYLIKKLMHCFHHSSIYLSFFLPFFLSFFVIRFAESYTGSVSQMGLQHINSIYC